MLSSCLRSILNLNRSAIRKINLHRISYKNQQNDLSEFQSEMRSTEERWSHWTRRSDERILPYLKAVKLPLKMALNSTLLSVSTFYQNYRFIKRQIRTRRINLLKNKSYTESKISDGSQSILKTSNQSITDSHQRSSCLSSQLTQTATITRLSSKSGQQSTSIMPHLQLIREETTPYKHHSKSWSCPRVTNSGKAGPFSSKIHHR